MKTWNKVQILEAGQKVHKLLEAESLPPEYLTYVDCVIDDLINVLEGRLQPLFSKETVLVPNLGFVPVVGEIDAATGEVTYYPDEEAV